jgi:4'-phosphopantetheinyl transferase
VTAGLTRAVRVVKAPVVPAWTVQGLLGEGEAARLATFRLAADRDRFATGRALLRETAGRWLGCVPGEVAVEATCARCGGPHGRPLVAGVEVGLAHAGDVVLVAVSGAGPVGVDVDLHRGVAFDGFDDVALTGAERTWVASLEPPARTSARALLWTRKEAVLKATGEGLTVPPSSVDVLGPVRRPGWGAVQLTDLDVGDGYAGCVAVVAAEPVPVRLETRAGAVGPARSG